MLDKMIRNSEHEMTKNETGETFFVAPSSASDYLSSAMSPLRYLSQHSPSVTVANVGRFMPASVSSSVKKVVKERVEGGFRIKDPQMV